MSVIFGRPHSLSAENRHLTITPVPAGLIAVRSLRRCPAGSLLEETFDCSARRAAGKPPRLCRLRSSPERPFGSGAQAGVATLLRRRLRKPATCLVAVVAAPGERPARTTSSPPTETGGLAMYRAPPRCARHRSGRPPRRPARWPSRQAPSVLISLPVRSLAFTIRRHAAVGSLVVGTLDELQSKTSAKKLLALCLVALRDGPSSGATQESSRLAAWRLRHRRPYAIGHVC